MATGESWCNAGVKNIMSTAFSGTATMENLKLFFFSNDYTPAAGCTYSNLIEIGTSTGLAGTTLFKINFGTASISVGTTTVISMIYNENSPLEWTLTDTQTMYGYAIQGLTTSNMYYVKNVGLHSFEATDTYIINPLTLRMEI